MIFCCQTKCCHFLFQGSDRTTTCPDCGKKKHPPCHARGTHRLFSPAHRGARPRPSFRVSTAKDLPNNTGRSFTCRFHLSCSLRLLWGSARRRNVITLLGSATCLAGHRLDVVCAQVQRTDCNQIVEVTLHHCFVTLLYVIFTRPFPRSLLLSYTEQRLKTRSSFYEY